VSYLKHVDNLFTSAVTRTARK